jgi:hypothetical protein
VWEPVHALSLVQLQCNNAIPFLAFIFFLLFLTLSISLAPTLPFFNLFLSQQILPLLKRTVSQDGYFLKAPKIK